MVPFLGRWAEVVDGEHAWQQADQLTTPGARLLAHTAVLMHLPDGPVRRERVGLTAIECASLNSPETRAVALESLVPVLATLLVEALRGLWQEMLPILARRIRRQLTYDLYLLGPAIVRLGGQAAMGAVVGAVRDVSRWWP